MKKLIIAVFLLIRFGLVVSGQTKSNHFPWKNESEKRQHFFEATIKDLKDMDVEIFKPKGFSEYIDGVFRFPEIPVNVQDHYTICFINQDSSIYLGLAVYSASEESIRKRNESMKIARPDWVKYDADSTWIYHTRYSADTSCNPITLYQTSLKSFSNSDDVAEYNRIEKAPLLERFYIYKTITYHKRNRGFISLSFFSQEKLCNNRLLDKLIKDNRKIVVFK